MSTGRVFKKNPLFSMILVLFFGSFKGSTCKTIVVIVQMAERVNLGAKNAPILWGLSTIKIQAHREQLPNRSCWVSHNEKVKKCLYSTPVQNKFSSQITQHDVDANKIHNIRVIFSDWKGQLVKYTKKYYEINK